MTDHLSSRERSRNMAAIRGRNTSPEIAVRQLAYALGYRFRLHRADLPGRPDLVFSSKRAVITVNGCFWHQHSSRTCKARPPKSNLDYWLPKLKRNVERDVANRRRLRKLGWRVMVVWECQTLDKRKLAERLSRFLQSEATRRSR
ncbi:MAG: DNA mismatch endonuclease Vsr [Betaproteobacteria bacterium]|nr:MAG: DNA mismatch endonuclease Vsr [Betaproteobacteria bacterium]